MFLTINTLCLKSATF